jgi:hypothetical protein
LNSDLFCPTDEEEDQWDLNETKFDPIPGN